MWSEMMGTKSTFNVGTDGVTMCAEVFNGKPIQSHAWWEKNWSEDCSLEVGLVKLSKAAVVGTHVDICKSFPDWYFNVVEAPAAQANGTVTCVVEAAGTHTGEPYACMPGLEVIPATGRTVKMDPERVTTFFNDEGKIVKQIVESWPGGPGFGGPPGFYRQIGGRLSFNVATDGVAMLAEFCNGKPIWSLDWWERNLSEDFSFEAGSKGFSKAALLVMISDLCKSFPGWYSEVVEAPAVQADGTVMLVARTIGIHTGEPYACMSEVEDIPATGMACGSDPAKVITFFNDQGKIMRQTAEPLPGGRVLGFYRQIGCRLPFNVATDGVSMLAEVCNGKPVWSLDWWERNLSEDFSLEASGRRISKTALIPLLSDLCKSFPGWHSEVVEAPALQADGTVMHVSQLIGTHTGEPYACMSGVEAIPATGIACASDASQCITFFNDQGKIMRQTVERLPGGKGFHGGLGFYLQIGGKLPFDVMADGVAMCAEVFNGKPIQSHEWWEKNWSESSSFEVGSVKLSKAAVLETHVDICKSFPGWSFNVVVAPAAHADGSVTCVVEATGTHTGEAYACMPGLEAIPATGRFVKNDPEMVTTFFNDEGKIVRQTVEPLSDGKGFGGPQGFYLQIGGVIPSDDLKADPVSPTSPIRGGS